MKRIFVLSILLALLFSCSSEDLTRQKALEIIKRDANYPRLVDYDLYCADEDVARRVMNAGLEDSGLVIVQKTIRLMDIGKPLIRLTAKADPYLLPTSDKDKSIHVQKVKIADENIVEITGIQTLQDGKQAIVEYSVAYNNVTGFSRLMPQKDFSKTTTKQVHLSLFDDGWRLHGK